MKKRLLVFLLMLTFAISIFPASVCAAHPLDGTYEGWYYANQGQTGLTLTLKNGEGVFEFYNMPGRSNAKDGSYTVKVTDTADGYRVDGVEWIEKPSTYSFVYLEGTLSDNVFKGYVDGRSWEFVLTKNNESYQQISDSIHDNHKYEVIDNPVSWAEAKTACEKTGGHLVTITSKEEQKFIEALISDKKGAQYWIGASSQDGQYEWITGEKLSYTNWNASEPSNNTRSDGKKELYAKLVSEDSFKWSDTYEDNISDDSSAAPIGYICEWETWTNSAQWSTPELEKAEEYGLIPDVLIAKDMTQPITRGEFAAVCVKLFESMTGGRAVMSSDCKFEDIASNENRNYILKAYNIGAVLGISETEYAPDTLLSREQLATMLTRVYKRCEWPDWTIATDDNYTINYSGVQKFADDADISDYAKPSVYFMVKYNVLSGIGNNKFAPKNTTPAQEAEGYANATREQAIVMSLRSFENLK